MFAHGLEELKMYQPVLKAKKCRNYHVDGYCRFGERCNFRHEKDAKPRKKKNLYKFHKILNSYPDIILRSMINETSRAFSFAHSFEHSLQWMDNKLLSIYVISILKYISYIQFVRLLINVELLKIFLLKQQLIHILFADYPIIGEAAIEL